MKGFPRHFPGEPPPDDDAPRRPTAPTLPRQGGISFEDDDLSDYMHPDDVPAKDPGAGEA